MSSSSVETDSLIYPWHQGRVIQMKLICVDATETSQKEIFHFSDFYFTLDFSPSFQAAPDQTAQHIQGDFFCVRCRVTCTLSHGFLLAPLSSTNSSLPHPSHFFSFLFACPFYVLNKSDLCRKYALLLE